MNASWVWNHKNLKKNCYCFLCFYCYSKKPVTLLRHVIYIYHPWMNHQTEMVSFWTKMTKSMMKNGNYKTNVHHPCHASDTIFSLHPQVIELSLMLFFFLMKKMKSEKKSENYTMNALHPYHASDITFSLYPQAIP